MKGRTSFPLVLLPWTCAVVLLVGVPAGYGQWPQFGGPQRNFSVNTARLADKWPDEGPSELWRRELGDGYGTILVDGDALYVMYRIDQDEFTVSLNRKTGETLWEHKIPSPTTKLMEQYGAGPSSTPLIVGNRLYTIGTNMLLHCFNKKTGDVIWKHDLVMKFGATVPGRGYCASPIAYGDTVILPVGGDDKEGQSVVAFSQSNGAVIWQDQSFQVTYASPILIHFQGEDQLVFFMGSELVGLDPNSGELLWSHPHKTQYGANLSTPVFDGKDILFCSAAYDSGARAIRLSREGGKTVAKELWYSRKMRLHHGNAVQFGGYVYGSTGDFGPAFFMGMNLETGKIAWRQRGFKKATCVYGDGKVIILDEDGKLALATLSPDGLNILSTCEITERYSWAAPTLAGRTLYVRDRKTIMALDVG
ncbi:MAG: PQQ-like beta-propeller repeat protein [Planctomycetes bacterium]|nr:PQQ-like beta-propeller repeat protein [Planctomycetota bacterium]